MTSKKTNINFNDSKNWVHPDELRDFEKQLRSFIYTKDSTLRKQIHNVVKNGSKQSPEDFINRQLKMLQSAYRIHNYMKFRAYKEFPDSAEDERYQHTPQFYSDGFKSGCYTFFGIECCSCLECCGLIIKDTQNPEAYTRFVEYEKRMKGPTVH